MKRNAIRRATASACAMAKAAPEAAATVTGTALATPLAAATTAAVAAALSALLLAGCADLTRPAAAELTAPALPALSSALQHADLLNPSEPSVRWWEGLGSPELRARVEAALRGQPSLEVAAATLRAAHANAAAQFGAYAPQGQIGAGASRNRNAAGILAPPLNSPANPYSLLTTQLSVSYAPDVFGANARAVENLQAQEDVLRQQAAALGLSVAANAASAAIQESALQAILATQQLQLVDQRRLLALTQLQQQRGALAPADVLPVQAALLALEGSVPLTVKLLEQTRDLAAQLEGHAIAQGLSPAPGFDGLPPPGPVPVGLPSTLLARRPDVAAAAAQVRAANAALGIADAAQWPQFTLSGNLGSTATRIAELMASGSNFWGLGANLSAVVFDGGVLAQRKEAARAQLAAAQAQYRQTAVLAIQGAADALQAWDKDSDVWRTAQAAQDAALRGLALVRSQQRHGAAAEPAVLQADLAWLQAVQARQQAEQTLRLDQIAVYQALAGGIPPAPLALAQ